VSTFREAPLPKTIPDSIRRLMQKGGSKLTETEVLKIHKWMTKHPKYVKVVTS